MSSKPIAIVRSPPSAGDSALASTYSDGDSDSCTGDSDAGSHSGGDPDIAGVSAALADTSLSGGDVLDGFMNPSAVKTEFDTQACFSVWDALLRRRSRRAITRRPLIKTGWP